MHSNSTSFAVHPGSSSLIEVPQALSTLHLLYLITQLPVMRSKAAPQLPDQPHRAAMRERRDQRKMDLSELKRIRAIESPAIMRLESSEVHETPKLVPRKPIPSSDDKESQSDVNKATFFTIGPPGAEANPMSDRYKKESGKFSIDEFEKKYSKYFEIWVSPSARAAKSVNGVFFVFGEMHHDPEIVRYFSQMGHYLLEKSAQLRTFLEGDSMERSVSYARHFGLRNSDCHALENDSEEYKKSVALMSKALTEIKKCYAFVVKALRLTPDPALENALYHGDIAEFLDQVIPQLSDPAYKELEPMIKKFSAANSEAQKYREKSRPIRDAQMASKARNLRSLEGANLMLVGSNHLLGVREHLRDQPCVFLKPKKIAQPSLKENPARNSGQTYKKDL